MNLSQIIAKIKSLWQPRYEVWTKMNERDEWQKIEAFHEFVFARLTAVSTAYFRQVFSYAIYDRKTKKQIYGNLWGYPYEFIANHS